MGLESVKEEVIRQAKEEETALMAEARKEANKIMKEAERKIDEMREKSEAETRKMIDLIKRQELASAGMENKKMLLQAKKQAIEGVFIEAQKRLEKLESKKREIYIKKFLEKTKNEVEIAYIYCNKSDIRFLKDLNAGAIGIIGGLIAENKEKTIRVDNSFETMLESIEEKEMQNINKILFG